MQRKRTLTPRLPALRVATESLILARAMIRQFQGSGSPWGPTTDVLSAQSGSEFFQTWFKPMLATAAGRMDLVALARAGSVEAHAVLEVVILEGQSRRAELPVELQSYAMDLTRGYRPSGPAGERRSKRFTRDMFIALIVAALRDRFALKPTGKAKERQ